jgi:hypothetical protein
LDLDNNNSSDAHGSASIRVVDGPGITVTVHLIENNPMQSNRRRWHGCFSLRKHFDTCRANQRHHSIIVQFVKPLMALPIENCGDLNPFGFGDSALVNGFPVRTASASRLSALSP